MRAKLLLACFAVLLLSPPPAVAAPRTHVVVIDKMKFGAMPAAVRAGDRIKWINRDLFRHTATASAGGFDVDLQPGMTKTIIMSRTGSFAVTCRYHPGMRATLKVLQ
ncbi:cupredoxin domain-containing protein [Sphingomonas sp. G124]|uniref:Cupredoxin domain-containing protein n=1 Tax=Sphingomonas cremea TaxID=2904799 RepID=A0A9X1QPX2_9SPHN|nr:cupredoxin domain-containing protein [Sphingomonas cremea]MCF2515838.1 cupredoxin domain-containing protein [Sphingomonas cremea]